MLRFFRNIRRQVLGEGRITRYLMYAVGEILLVVIGILIALQINTWNQHRENRMELRILLNAFQTEINLNVKDLDYRIKDSKHVRSVLMELLKHMGPDYQQAPSRLIDSLFFEGISITLFDPNKASFINLTRSGQLKYIENDSLHQILIGWDSKLEELANAEASLFHTFKTIVLPHFYDKLSLVRLDRQFATGYESMPPSAFEFDNRLALTRIETENILEDHFYNLGRVQQMFEGFYTDLELLNRLIDDEIK
ncbi:MAG: DUF6090 family protein [Flavobacteriaceae bacterium]